MRESGDVVLSKKPEVLSRSTTQQSDMILPGIGVIHQPVRIIKPILLGGEVIFGTVGIVIDGGGVCLGLGRGVVGGIGGCALGGTVVATAGQHQR